MRNKVTDHFLSTKVCKAISDALELQWTTVRPLSTNVENMEQRCTFSEVAQITKSEHQPLAHDIAKDPKQHRKQLSLASATVRFHNSTIRKRPGKNDIHVSRAKPPMNKQNPKENVIMITKTMTKI